MIERDQNNALTASSRAAVAVRGMPPGEISDKLEAYENLLYRWLGVEINDDGWIVRRRWFNRYRELVMNRIAKTPVAICRSEVADLALACAKFMNDARAAAAREQFYKEYCRMVEENRELRLFLGEHFAQELKEAESRNISIPVLLKEIILRFKNQ